MGGSGGGGVGRGGVGVGGGLVLVQRNTFTLLNDNVEKGKSVVVCGSLSKRKRKIKRYKERENKRDRH